MPVYALLALAIIFLVIVIVLVCKDKKKRLSIKAQKAGSICFILSVTMFVLFFAVNSHFTARSYQVKKKIMSDLCGKKDVMLVSSPKKSSVTLTAAAYESSLPDKKHSYIEYTDQFLNRQTVPLSDIVRAYTDKDLSCDKVRIERILCQESDGFFIKWRIDYGLYIGSDSPDTDK